MVSTYALIALILASCRLHFILLFLSRFIGVNVATPFKSVNFIKDFDKILSIGCSRDTTTTEGRQKCCVKIRSVHAKNPTWSCSVPMLWTAFDPVSDKTDLFVI